MRTEKKIKKHIDEQKELETKDRNKLRNKKE